MTGPAMNAAGPSSTSAATKRDRARDRARPFARHAAAVVAALDDPLAIGSPTGDHADVMRPENAAYEPRNANGSVPLTRGTISRFG